MGTHIESVNEIATRLNRYGLIGPQFNWTLKEIELRLLR